MTNQINKDSEFAETILHASSAAAEKNAEGTALKT
jgi:hypothetical protein